MSESAQPLTGAGTGVLHGAPSFSLGNRLSRALWLVAWTVLARWTPPAARRWRVLLLNLFGARVHPSSVVYASAVIWYPPYLTMAAGSVMGPGVRCYCMAPISLGEGAIVSQRAHLCAGTHDIDDPEFQLEVHPIWIGASAWVGAEAFVGPGVRIGEGAVLGARGVAASDLEAGSVYAGNPARFLRKRGGC
jgi:putative colanic acid biosynthesis acetyltransferase WcaF